MIKQVQGCVFDYFENKTTAKRGLVHQCNCFSVMGSGIAREIKTRYPSAYKADKEFFLKLDDRLGHFSYSRVDGSLDYRFVFNVYGQFGYGGQKIQTNYKALENGLGEVLTFCDEHKIKELCIPHGIGCGLGGGDWEIVSGIIDDVFGENQIDVFVCRKL